MPKIACTPECPLTSANPLPKFCPECGAASASKIVHETACESCKHVFGPSVPKFCPECGTRTSPAGPAGDLFTHYGIERPAGPVGPDAKPYGSVNELIARHEEARARASGTAPTGGRGLTAEEVERMTANARRGRTADRVYTDPADDEAYKSVSGLSHVDEDDEAAQLARGRRGVEGAGGAAEAGRFGSKGIGALAPRGAKLDPDYHEHVRVLPYSFKTPARTGREVVGTGRPPEDKGGQLSDEEAAFYSPDQLDAAAARRLLNAKSEDE